MMTGGGLAALYVTGLALAAATVLLSAGEAGAADATANWPGAKWDTTLSVDREEFVPLRQLLTELATAAGCANLALEADEKVLATMFQTPLPAGLALRQAFERAASINGLTVAVEGDKLVVRSGGKAGPWEDLVGAKVVSVAVAGTTGRLYLPVKDIPRAPRPWVWYAPNGLSREHAWMVRRLMAKGIAVATVNVGESMGNPKGRATFTAFYEKLVREHGLAPRVVLLPQSRGGLMLYNWAAEHPEAVAAIGGIYTVCDLRSYPGMEKAATAYGMTVAEMEAHLAENNPIDRLAPLVKAGVPIFHIHGDKDSVVPLEKNSAELVKRYKASGGKAELKVIPDRGHQTAAEFFQCPEMIEFLTAQAEASVKEQEK